jgi:predicted permease
MNGTLRWDELRRNLKTALRVSAADPVGSIASVVTLAVVVALSVSFFAIVNGFLLKPLAVSEPARLMRFDAGGQVTLEQWRDLASATNVFVSVEGSRAAPATLSIGAAEARVTSEVMTPGYLDAAAPPVRLGRLPTASDEAPVAVLSDGAWRLWFGARPDVVGQSLRLDGRLYTVVAVLAPAFRGVSLVGSAKTIWIARGQLPPGSPVSAIARLRPSVTRAAAASAVRTVAPRIWRTSDGRPWETSVDLLGTSGLDAFDGLGAVAVPMFAFIALLGLTTVAVLFIGSANVAALLMGRAQARAREMALRLALGANRGRLARQLLTEGALIAVAGTAAGLLLATISVRALTSSVSGVISTDFSVDPRVCAFAAALAALITILTGLAPVRHASATDIRSLIGGTSGGTRPIRQRRRLVRFQVAASATLLVVAVLFLRSASSAGRVDPGFDTTGVVVIDVAPPPMADDAAGAVFVADVIAQITRISGVADAGAAFAVPLSLTAREEFSVLVDGYTPRASSDRLVSANRISPGYLSTVGIALRAGRDIAWDDREGAERAVLVNDTAARRFWPNRSPLGETIQVPAPKSLRYVTAKVVGVVADSKYETLGEAPRPIVYLSFQQYFMPEMHVHAKLTPGTPVDRIRDAIRTLVPDRAVDITPLSQLTAHALWPAAIAARLTGALGGIALLLALIGLYGTLSNAIAARRRELGVRKALGSTGTAVGRLLISDSLRLILPALGVGLLGGAVIATAASAFLVGIAPYDPPTYAIVAVANIAAALAGVAVPTMRAIRLSPLEALRHD